MTKLNVIRNPSGTFGFVGSVPMVLAFEKRDGTPIGDKLAASIRHTGPGLYRDMIRPRSWSTKATAHAAASELGFEVKA